MNKLLFILLLSPLFSFAQTDNLKAKPYDEFCVLYFGPRAFSSKLNITIDFGYDMTVDTLQQVMTKQQLRQLGAVKQLQSVAQTLNYMSLEGWEFVNSYKPSTEKWTYPDFIFRRKKE
jgi:hypothetical protein